jgi:hypothetical protein
MKDNRNFGGAGWKMAKLKTSKFIVKLLKLIRISGSFVPPPKEVNSSLRFFVK